MLRRADLRQCGSQARGKLVHVVVGPEVHEEEPRLFLQHMAVKRGDRDSILTKGLDHRIIILTDSEEGAFSQFIFGTPQANGQRKRTRYLDEICVSA